jgi:hypothetical protein
MAFLHALLVVLWLLGLWAAAFCLQGGPRAADRVRDMLVIGTVIPLVLGFLHLLSWPFCWLALIGCVIAARLRAQQPPKHRSHEHPEPKSSEPVPYLLLGALALLAWAPPLHPQAPWGAPERFATALSVVATPAAVGWTGFGALALLGLRIFSWAREGALLPLRLADALAAATVCIFPFALQSGAIRNDVWLAAFFVETLWSAPVDDITVLRSAAMCALVTPLGWLYAAVALGASRARRRAWIAAGISILIWATYDVIRWRAAFFRDWATAVAHAFRTHEFAHALAAIHFGFISSIRFAPFGLLLVLIALASPLLNREAPLRFAGIAAVVVALLVESTFDPAMAAGALILAPHTLRSGRLALLLLFIALVAEALRVAVAYRPGAIVALSLVSAIAVPIGVGYARITMRRASLLPRRTATE